jgi:hypothetical protein
VRANRYLPVGTTSRFEALASPQFLGLNMLTGYDHLSLAGADIEGGVRPFEMPELWFFLGYYFYTDQDDILESDPLEGVRGRMELRPNRNLTLGVTVSHDDEYETQVFANATLSFRSFADFWSPPGTCDADPQFTQNGEAGLLIADVNLASFDLNQAGVDINAKGVSLADRGDLNIQISGNTISDNATTNALSPIGEALSDATLRDDRFGV